MSFHLKTSLLATALFAFLAGPAASAHPHDDHQHDEKEKARTAITFEEDLNRHFENHAKALSKALKSAVRPESRLKTKDESADDSTLAGGAKRFAEKRAEKRIELIENPEELRKAARSVQNMLAESGILESLADVVIDMAEDIEINDTGNGMRLSFNGHRIGGFSLDDSKDALSLEALGGSTTIEKDVIIQDGKKKTRIIITTDADEMDFDIVPKAKGPRKGTEF